MHLSQLDPQHAGRFRSTHSLFYDLPGDQTVLMLSGIAELNLRAPGWSVESADVAPYCLDFGLELQLPAGFLAPGQHFVVARALPSVGPGSLTGSGNVLWGITAFGVDAAQPLSASVLLQLQAEVARSSEVLNTVVYSLTLLGSRT
jgi:hypothetical protein